MTKQYTIIFSIGFTLISIFSFGQGISVPEVLHYKFNEIGTNVTNYASAPPAGTNTASILGAISQGGTGQCDGALIGSGISSSSDYLNTAWAPNLGTGAWTISFWSSGISSNATLYYVFGDVNSNSFRCFTNGVAGANNFILRGAGLTDIIANGAALSTPTLTTFVYDPILSNVKAYVNGVLNNTVAQGVVTLTGTGPLKVMGYNTNVGAPAGGLMDDFRLYSHALNSAEVLQLYTRQTSNTIAEISCGNYAAPSGAIFTSTGIYNDTIPNSSCGDSVITINLTINALPSVNGGNDETVCAGTSITLSGTGADTYSWDNAVTDGVLFTPSNNATYTVTGTNTVTGCANTDQVIVTVNALPIVNAGNDQTECAGTSITLSGTGADTYLWDNGVIDGLLFTLAANTTYTVTGTNTATGCANTDQVDVTVNALPIVNAGNDQTVCAGTSVTLSGTGADTYLWDNGVIDGLLFTPSNNTTYTLTGTNTATGCANTDQVDVTVNALPTVNAGNDQTICNGDNVILNGSGAATYTWDNAVIDGVSFVPTATEIYHLEGIDVNGCQGIDSVQVFINTASDSTLTETALDSYTLNGQTYTQSGTYSQVIPNTAGCDSTITLNLTMNFTGIDEMKNFAVSIYPNPSRDILFIHSEIELFSSFELIDNQGRIVLSDKLKGNQTSVYLEAIAPGNYYLKIEERNILVKVVKQ